MRYPVRGVPAARLKYGLPPLFALCLLCAGVLAGTVRAQSITPLSLPPGFSDDSIITGLLAPRAAVFTPDGRILVLERGSGTTNDQNTASVRVFKSGQLLPDRALTLDVCGDSERGLLGIALDPDFATNGYVYLYYTRQASQGAACVQLSPRPDRARRAAQSRFPIHHGRRHHRPGVRDRSD